MHYPQATRRSFVVGSSLVATALSVGALLMMPSAIWSVLSTNFLPHAYCYLNNRQLIALHVGSDTAIWLSYLAISATLVYLVRRTRREIPFSWMFLAFGLFIVACGFTHFMDVVVLWKPVYWLAGDVKLVTALASVVTAIALPGLVPQVHAMLGSARLSEGRRSQLEKTNQELQQLTAHITSVQDEERRRIARELHDSVGQYLAAIKMSCVVALDEARANRSPKVLEETLSLIDRCTSEVRTMSHLLHPPLLEEIGLSSAIPWLIDGFRQRSGIAVRLEMPPNLRRLPQPVELVLFRVLQESLTNIHRHSKSQSASISIRYDESDIRMSIEDAGVGFATDGDGAKTTGVGIAGMRERVRELRGELRIASSAAGTRIEVRLPVAKETTCQSAS